MRSTKEYAAPSILAIGIVFLVIGFVQQGFTFSMNLPEAVRPVFERLPKRFLRGTPVAAFDTSYKMSWWLRHFTAAKRLTRELRKLGGRRIVPPETFHVVGREGPLYEGEIERARAWAALILARLRQNAT